MNSMKVINSVHRKYSKPLFFVACLCIGAVSLLPQSVAPSVDVSDKLAHGAAYALLCLIGLGAYSEKKHSLIVVLGLVAYGAALELLQWFAPGRFPEVMDAIANAAGVIGAYALVVSVKYVVCIRAGRESVIPQK